MSNLCRASLVVCLVACTVPLRISAAEVIDRLIAIVGNRGITLSDLRAVTELGFLDRAVGSDTDAVRALVDRVLMLQEVERYGAGAPEEATVAKRLSEIEARLGPDGLATLMARAGVDRPRLQAIVREDLELSRYLTDRFGQAAQPTDDEVERYYREHPEEFSREGKVLPFAEAESAARAALTGRRRAKLVDQWIEGLRRRADVRIFWPDEARP
jgi:hypothetical protein